MVAMPNGTRTETRTRKRHLWIDGLVALVAVASVSWLSHTNAQTTTGSAPPVTVKAASGLPLTSIFTRGYQLFAEFVRKESKDRVTITYVGGPEVFPPYALVDSVKSGVIQIAATPCNWYSPLVPETLAIKLSDFPPWELRERGAYKVLDEAHAKSKLKLVAWDGWGAPFRIWLNKRIDRPDLKGLKLRVTGAHQAFIEALGGAAVSIAPPEIYPAMERGVIDGYGWPAVGINEFKWQEVTKFVVAQGYYVVEDCIVANLDFWQTLDPAQRDAINRAAVLMEREMSDVFKRVLAEQDADNQKRGLTFIRFSSDETKKFVEMANRVGWEEVLKKAPNYGLRLKQLMSRH